MTKRTWIPLIAVVVPLSCSEPASEPVAPRVPASRASANASPVAAAISLGAAPLAVDKHGVPRLLQIAHGIPVTTATASAAALIHVERLAPAWGVQAAALPGLEPIGEIAVRGGTIVRLRQSIAGLPIEGGELRVLVKPTGEVATVSGTLIGSDVSRTAPATSDDEVGAIAIAVGTAMKTTFDRSTLQRSQKNRLVFGGRSGEIDVESAIARQQWHREGDRLVAAWIVEAYAGPATSTTSEAFHAVVVNGKVVAQRSLTADSNFQYRVFAEADAEAHPFDGPIQDSSPHPTGAPDGTYPPFVLPNLVTVDGLNVTHDPWLTLGKTETNGNNVDAYADLTAPTGFSNGDFRATTTAAGVFDRSYNTALAPGSSQAQQMAGITSLFYGINWLHDFWYDAGFTEEAGNGQDSNLGRGGEDRDAIIAEAQDFSGRNNANMSTPADGLPPRMQVFVWSGKETRTLTITPANRTPVTGFANFGPNNFDITGALVVAVDATAPTGDACSPLTNNVTGKIVVIDRGTCGFKSKTLQAQNAGAIGVILANNAAGAAPPNLADDPTIVTPITIPTMPVTFEEGATLKTEIAGGVITAHFFRVVGTDLDGGLDSTLLSHEFGHYVHHRLQLCGTTMCGALSEGWGDFLALVTMARPGDNLEGAYPFSVYTTPSFSSDAKYFGIRRAPYSVNQAINSLSFRHMGAGEPLPTTHPFLVFGTNNEVHNAGEIWAATMWEVYVALQQSGTDFVAQRTKMKQYVVAGLLLAPTDGSPTETRDAILAAALASSQADHDTMAAAFARRGMGSCAVSPDRDSTTFTGIVESAVVAGKATPGTPVAAELTSCDNDGVLDGGETARITLPIANTGNAALTNATVTVTSTTPGITVVSAPVVIASLAAYASTEITVDVALDDTATTPLDGSFSIAIAAIGACNDPVTVEVPLRLNVDDVPAMSATDTFDTVTTVWTAPDAGWEPQRKTALDGIWHGTDAGQVSDVTLVSPALTAEQTIPVTITFSQAYSFELGGAIAFDGGVIEFSTDAGVTWTDISTLTTIGYGTTPIDGTPGGPGSNPLAGRLAFIGQNTAFPDFETVTLDLGTQLAGMTFAIRFRIGTDAGVGAPGWNINDLAFTGIVGTPFPVQVADTGTCMVTPMPDAGPGPVGPDSGVDPMNPGDDDGGCCDAGPLRGGNVAVALFVGLVLVLRRRKR
ncbi:MAG: M36 family metallopeptidase [Kofleriaceae bacterium]